MDLCIETTDVLPKSSKHLTGAKTLHESIQLCNGGAEGSTLDFSRLKEHQGTTGISPTFDSLISNENGHSTLRGFVAVIPEGCIRNANDPRRTLNRPHTHFNLIVAYLSAKLIKLLAVSNSWRS